MTHKFKIKIVNSNDAEFLNCPNWVLWVTKSGFQSGDLEKISRILDGRFLDSLEECNVLSHTYQGDPLIFTQSEPIRRLLVLFESKDRDQVQANENGLLRASLTGQEDPLFDPRQRFKDSFVEPMLLSWEGELAFLVTGDGWENEILKETLNLIRRRNGSEGVSLVSDGERSLDLWNKLDQLRDEWTRGREGAPEVEPRRTSDAAAMLLEIWH